MGKKVQFQQKKFSDLLKYKKRVPILFEGEAICTLEELTTEKLNEFMRMAFADVVDKVEQNDTKTILGLDDNIICFLLRNMIIDIDDIKDMPDDEIINVITNLGSEVQQQFIFALRELVISKAEQLIMSISRSIQELSKNEAESDENKKEN